jgi:nucleoside-diphosphate-sugar epimerase
MSRVLVTGHLGSIGKKLFSRLHEYYDDPLRLGGQWDVVGIDTKGGKDLLTCELPQNIDVIYHLAAHASVEDSWKDPLRDMQNLLTTVRLSQYYPNARIIYSATCAALNPVSPYAFSKRCAQDYLKIFHPNSVLCVFPNVFGTGHSVADYFKDKEKVTIYGDGNHTRNYVHIDDIVSGLDKAFSWIPGTYFMGGEHTYSVLELAEGKEVDFQPERKEAIESNIPNTTPNWKPKINVLDYINGN